jgi:predicted RNase H-like HicB family nuclease
MARARYKILDDGSYFGEIAGLSGVWADAQNLETCRSELQEVLEDWLIVKLRDGDRIPRIGRVRLVTKPA